MDIRRTNKLKEGSPHTGSYQRSSGSSATCLPRSSSACFPSLCSTSDLFARRLTTICLVRRQCQFFDLPDFLTYRATSDLARSNCSLACKCSYVPPEIPGSSGWSAELFNKIGLDQMVRRDSLLRSRFMTCLLTSLSINDWRSAGQGRLLRSRRPARQDRTHPHGRPARRRGSL